MSASDAFNFLEMRIMIFADFTKESVSTPVKCEVIVMKFTGSAML
jgi:hypothetical protein